MGEMADFVVEQIQNSHDDWESDMIEEELDGPFPAPTKTCRQCGRAGLHWQISKTSGGWRLYHKDGTIHNCSKKFKPNPSQAPENSAP